jgi:uncharacterized protein (DUF111 family)
VQLIECNVDDVSGEVVAHTIDALLAPGRHDAWATADRDEEGAGRHTRSRARGRSPRGGRARDDAVRVRLLGVRATALTRWPQRRDESTVVVDGHSIRVKVTDDRVKVETTTPPRGGGIGLPFARRPRTCGSERRTQPPSRLTAASGVRRQVS